MEVIFSYRGQLAHAAPRRAEVVKVEAGEELAEVLRALAARHGSQFAKFLCDENGRLQRALMVVIDGRQVQASEVAMREGMKEVILLPPFAGG